MAGIVDDIESILKTGASVYTQITNPYGGFNLPAGPLTPWSETYPVPQSGGYVLQPPAPTPTSDMAATLLPLAVVGGVLYLLSR